MVASVNRSLQNSVEREEIHEVDGKDPGQKSSSGKKNTMPLAIRNAHNVQRKAIAMNMTALQMDANASSPGTSISNKLSKGSNQLSPTFKIKMKVSKDVPASHDGVGNQQTPIWTPPTS